MDTIENVFINPPAFGKDMVFRGNPLWTVGDLQEITLRTNETDYSIALFQQSIDSDSPQAWNRQTVWTSPAGGGSGEPSFNWTVDNYGNSLEFSPVFYLGFVKGSEKQWPSHYFNITASSSATATNSPATVTVTNAPAATKTSAANAANTSPSTPASSQNSDNQNSNTSTLAIGLGAGLGAALLILAVVGTWLAMRLRKAKKPAAVPLAVSEEIVKHDHNHPYAYYPSPAYKPPLHEAGGYMAPAELDRGHSPVEIGLYR